MKSRVRGLWPGAPAPILLICVGFLAQSGCSDPTAGTVEIGADRDAVRQQIVNPGAVAAEDGARASSDREKVATPGGKPPVP